MLHFGTILTIILYSIKRFMFIFEAILKNKIWNDTNGID